MTELKIVGNLFDDKKGMTGNMKIGDADFSVEVEPEAKQGAKASFYPFVAKPKDGGNDGKDITGAMFRSDRYFNQINKPGIRMLFKLTVDGGETEVSVVGFYKDTKRDGSKAKAPYYSLAASKPKEVGSAEPPAPF